MELLEAKPALRQVQEREARPDIGLHARIHTSANSRLSVREMRKHHCPRHARRRQKRYKLLLHKECGKRHRL
jgi:hypothetical protein